MIKEIIFDKEKLYKCSICCLKDKDKEIAKRCE